MTPKDVSKVYPNAAELGRQLGVTGACVNMWRVRGAVPIMAQIRLHNLSGGKLRLSRPALNLIRRMNLEGALLAPRHSKA